MCKEQINKHSKYGNVKSLNRHSNGHFRSRTRNHRLKLKLECENNAIWTTGVFFDDDKNRIVWYNNLWNRKYWRGMANRRIRYSEDVPDYGSYKKFFYMVLNCDNVCTACNYKKVTKNKLDDSSENEENKVRQKRNTVIRTYMLRWLTYST